MEVQAVVIDLAISAISVEEHVLRIVTEKDTVHVGDIATDRKDNFQGIKNSHINFNYLTIVFL